MKRRLLSGLLVIVLIISMIPVTVAYAATYSGSLSTTVFWELDTNECVLTIYGSGAIPAQPNLGKPWSAYDKYIKHIVIEKGITQIGEYAFSEMRYFEDIIIPQGVTGIDGRAFQYATAMKTIYIPLSCTWMGFCAFNYCWGLTDVYYEGTASQFNAISKTYAGLGGFDDLFDATKHYNYRYPLNASQMAQEEANQYVQEHLSFVASNKYSNLTTNASFYNSIWKHEEGSNNFTRYAAWDVIGRVGKGISLDVYGVFKTDNPYDIILADVFRSYVNKEKNKFLEVFEKTTKFVLSAPSVVDQVLAFLKTSEAWDASYERNWKQYMGQVQSNWIEGVFLTESNFDMDDYYPELYETLNNVFKTDKTQLETVFKGIKNTGAICDYITSGTDIVWSFLDAYQKYQLAVALYETNEYVLSSVQVIAMTHMSNENASLLHDALLPYWDACDYDSAYESVMDIMTTDGVLDLAGNTLSKLGQALLKDFIYAAVQKITGMNATVLSLTYNLTYACLDYLSGLGDLSETHRLMNAAALLEKEYIELAKIQANTLSAEKTYAAAANFDTTWSFLQSLESYCYKTMSVYLSAFKREYKTNYNVKTSVVQNYFYTAAKRIELTEKLKACDAAMQAVVYLESEWTNGDCHKGIYSSSNLMTVKCPTDVYVYDSENEIVLSIIDNKVTYCAAHIAAFVDVDEKIFVLPTDQKYDVKIVATDDGTMDYAVKSFDEIELLRTVIYDDIEITNESNYVATVLPELYIPKEEYNVITDDGEQVDADFDSMEIETFSFKDAFFSLQHNLAINFTAEKALFEEKGYTAPYAIFELNGVKEKIEKYTISGDHYVFTLHNIALEQLNGTIDATLYATYDGVEYAGATMEYSIAEHWNYTIDNDTVTVTGYTGEGGTVVVPTAIEDCPVTAIAFGAFYEDTDLTDIAIPDSVTAIGEDAFYGCSNLTIYGSDGSYAQQHAEVNSIPFVVLENYRASNGEETFATLQAALDAYEGGIIQLLADVGSVTVTKNAVVDLNGFDIASVAAIAGELTVLDSKTDDYSVAGNNYGKITSIVGNVTPAAGYVAIAEEDGTSYHKVSLKITHMSLRSADAGVYYKCTFEADEIVASKVTSYGVALSVRGIPAIGESGTGYSAFTDFISGTNTPSTLLKNVMKDSNEAIRNNSNADAQVRGRAYIQIGDTYIYGETVSRSFREQVELVDTIWSTLTSAQQTAILAMYRTFRETMETWTLPNIKNSI